MNERSSVLIVRDDGVIDVPGAMPIVPGLLETVERLYNALGIPTHEQHNDQRQEDER